MGKSKAENFEKLKKWAEKFPFLATVSTAVTPTTVSAKTYGPHASTIIHTGYRTYAFQNEDGRDAFLKRFDGYKSDINRITPP